MAASLAPPNLRLICASKMAPEAIISIDLIALAYIPISLGHMSIDPSFGDTMVIIYRVCEVVAVNDCDGSATA